MDIIASVQNSQAVILCVVGIIILLIIIGGVFKGKGFGWIIWLLIAGIVGYLLISAEILQIP